MVKHEFRNQCFSYKAFFKDIISKSLFLLLYVKIKNIL